MTDTKPAFVLVHGAWHSSATWKHILPLLEAQGHAAIAPDLPGAGANARRPLSYHRRPFDANAFATEPSPNARVTQEERTSAIADKISIMVRDTGQPVVLVGHSLGGVTVTAVAEAFPERIRAAVYLAALLLPYGVTVADAIEHPSMGGAKPSSLSVGDPAALGALRVNPAAESQVYRQTFKSVLYGDLTDQAFDDALASLHCDEPAQVAGVPSPATANRFGRVPRHYIRCTGDQALPIAGQDYMISNTDDILGGRTLVHTLETSHSPFYSQPQALADVLLEIAGSRKPQH